MTTETKYWYLHNHQLFDELARHQLNEICYLSHFRTNRKDEVVVLPQDEARIFTLKVGVMKIVELDTDGNERLIDILRPGDLFGQFTLTHQESNQYAVVLSDTVTFCSFLVADFEAIMLQNPSLSIRYTKLVGLRFRRLENRYSNLLFKDVRTRLRLFLKEWADRDGRPDRPHVLNNYLSHKDISRMIGSNRQTVTELFNEFRDLGMLSYDRSQINIIDPALLDV